MKSFVRSLVKILYVVVLPLAFVIGTYNFVTNYDVDTFMLTLITLVGVVVVANSVMYLVFMQKIKMFPNVKVEFIPIFGFAFGVDPDINHRVSWLLLIPFVSFEFSIEKK
jgi:hypothetical protein